MGIEPIFSDRKSDVLANYTNGALAVLTGFEPVTSRETVGHSNH